MNSNRKTNDRLESIHAEYVKRNKAFKKANKKRRRIMIAKDALEQLNQGNIVPTRGLFLKVDIPIGEPERCGNIPLNETIEAKNMVCNCCALGSLMLGGLRMYDGVRTVEVRDTNGVLNQYSSSFKSLFVHFNGHQLRCMEVAFEFGQGIYKRYNFEDAYEYEFYADYFDVDSDPVFRMRTILENIIKNKGDFDLGYKKGKIYLTNS